MTTVQRVFLFITVVGLGAAAFLALRPVDGFSRAVPEGANQPRSVESGCGSALAPHSFTRRSDFSGRDQTYLNCPNDIPHARTLAITTALASVLVGGAGLLIFRN